MADVKRYASSWHFFLAKGPIHVEEIEAVLWPHRLL
jgi:hypothetical protein